MVIHLHLHSPKLTPAMKANLALFGTVLTAAAVKSVQNGHFDRSLFAIALLAGLFGLLPSPAQALVVKVLGVTPGDPTAAQQSALKAEALAATVAPGVFDPDAKP